MGTPWKPPSEEAEEAEDREWDQIIHNVCGLPIELCECPDIEIKLERTDER